MKARAKQRQQIHISRLLPSKKREALRQSPARAKPPPASLVDNAAATRRSPSSSSFSLSPVTTQSNATAFRQSFSSKTSPADVAPCRHLMQSDFTSCRLRPSVATGTVRSAVSLMPSPLSFRLEVKQVLNTQNLTAVEENASVYQANTVSRTTGLFGIFV